MTNGEQTRCPEPGCVTSFSAPEAFGWTLIDDLWWCPLHASGESRRLQKQRDAVDWYDGNIRVREKFLANHADDEKHVLAAVKVAQLNRKDPRVRQRLAEVERQNERVLRELAELRDNRDAAVARHELENEVRRNNLQSTDEASEDS